MKNRLAATVLLLRIFGNSAKKRATANRIKNEIVFIVQSVTGDVMLLE